MAVWMVTGGGNGLGRHVVEAALGAGHHVVAGARRVQELDTLVERFGAHLSPFPLDVRDEPAARAAVQHAVDRYGSLDVLVNNAGYQRNAPFEQLSTDEFRDVVETCLFGVVNTTRAAVPVMRRQRRGCILQVSSIGGRATIPGNSPYHAAKWAVGGFSDSLAAEVEPLGIRVCTLEPGGMRTDFARRAFDHLPALLPDYEASVGAVFKSLANARAGSQSDPAKVAGVILRLAGMNELPRRLVLGLAAQRFVDGADARRNEEALKFSDLTRSTEFTPQSP